MRKNWHGVLSKNRNVCKHNQILNPLPLTMPILPHQLALALKNTRRKKNPSAKFISKVFLRETALRVTCKLIFSLLFLGSVPTVAASDYDDLRIEVSGFDSNNGQFIAKLFSMGDDVLKEGRWQASSSIDDKHATLTFSHLPPGQYAVVVFHDLNSNGVIDHNFIGLPTESLGFSNNFSLSPTSGLPNFDKLKFSHFVSPQTISIILNK
jgi:uncharacterized protein (DUF2141 family)